MNEFVLQRGTIFFLPLVGMRKVVDFDSLDIAGEIHQVCIHTGHYVKCDTRQLETALYNARARPASSQSVAKTVKEKLGDSRKTNPTQNWFKDKKKDWDVWLKRGTFEKNVSVLRALYRPDTKRWTDDHLQYYQKVLGLVQEEWAYVFNKTPQLARHEIEGKLNYALT